ncbi:MAG: hypothetical protein SH856_08535 [Flavobacteriales bacterium]|nr:hypothetical protein [Flavobacteriales bacterium]
MRSSIFRLAACRGVLAFEPEKPAAGHIVFSVVSATISARLAVQRIANGKRPTV